MPIRANLITEITSAQGAFSSLNLCASSAPWDLYECYLFGLVLQAARRLNAMVAFENILGRPSTNLLFRVSPGNIYRPSPPRPPILYTHAVLRFPPQGVELEVHQGIYVSGKSGLPHECDVSVIDRAEGVACRRERAHPRCRKAILAVECKFYSSLAISLARGFIGLTSDLANDDRFFVTNTEHNNLERLLTHHDRAWGHRLIPAEQVEVNRVRSLFETALKKHLARA
jgi:hypothetical protein